MENFFAGLRGAYRLLLFKILILSYLAWSYICHWTIRDTEKRLQAFSVNTGFFSRLMLKGLNLDLQIKNMPIADQKFLMVSNHMGFVDILMLASCVPTVFVTSHEMKETPFLGLLTEMAGCIYVERRSRTKILDELGSIVKVLQQGFRVTLYPEATSTNGEKVLPFKKTLLMAAAQAGVPIQPVVVNFRQINGEEFSLKWRDHVCWYGDMSFVSAMWKTLTLKSVVAEVEFLEQVQVDPVEDRGLVAVKIHRMISEKFVPVRGGGDQATVVVELEADLT